MCNRTLLDGFLPTSQLLALVTPLLEKEMLDPTELKKLQTDLQFIFYLEIH